VSTRFRPNVTVAAVIEQQGRFLLVEEHTPEGLRLNNPAGHLEPHESLVDACVRETLEETAYLFTPTALVGAYLSRQTKALPSHLERVDLLPSVQTPTYLRFAFTGQLGLFQEGRVLDNGIVRTVWLSYEELKAQAQRLRNPMVLSCVTDYLAGQRFSLELLHTDLA
jgi:8-oxo-dGTP pyrophosphatase MutT (NUDIX family)